MINSFLLERVLAFCACLGQHPAPPYYIGIPKHFNEFKRILQPVCCSVVSPTHSQQPAAEWVPLFRFFKFFSWMKKKRKKTKIRIHKCHKKNFAGLHLSLSLKPLLIGGQKDGGWNFLGRFQLSTSWAQNHLLSEVWENGGWKGIFFAFFDLKKNVTTLYYFF